MIEFILFANTTNKFIINEENRKVQSTFLLIFVLLLQGYISNKNLPINIVNM